VLDFLVIGAQKASTSWLFQVLSMHPRTYFPLGKEVNFWCDDNKDESFFTYYRQRFSDGYLISRNKYICGDMSPSYAPMSRHKIARIYKWYPNVKVVYILREPLARSWSALQMSLDARKESAPSAEKASAIMTSNGVISHSNYAANLDRWRNVIDESESKTYPLTIIQERIEQDPLEALGKICEFLGLDSQFYHDLPRQHLEERVLQGSREPLLKQYSEECTQVYSKLRSLTRQSIADDIPEWPL